MSSLRVVVVGSMFACWAALAVVAPALADEPATEPGAEPAVADDVVHPDKALCAVCAARASHGDPQPEKVAAFSAYEGKYHYFCSKNCKKEFDEAPAWWLPLDLPRPLPTLALITPEGKPASIEALPGRVMVVDFWATWCKPCGPLMDHLQKLGDRHPASALQVVGIAIDEGDDRAAKVAKYRDKRGVTYPIYIDGDGDPSWVTLKVHAVPTTLIVDRDGQIVRRWVGEFDASEVDAEVARLLLPPASAP